MPSKSHIQKTQLTWNRDEEFEEKISSLTSQLNESRNKLSDVEKNYKLLTGDQDALSNTSLEKCDELILTLSRSQEKLLQRRVSNEPYLIIIYELSC